MQLRFYYLVFLLCLPSYSQAALLEQGFQADYTLSKNDFDIGVAEYRLYPQPTGILIYESTAKPEGLAAVFIRDRIVERSQIMNNANHLQPLKYEYLQKGGKETKNYQLNFDWADKKLRNTNINQSFDLPDNTQDMLSFQLQLMKTLQDGKKRMLFHLADDDQIKAYQLEYIREMKLATQIGEMKVVLLEHRRTDRNDTFRFWCAPSLEYLPVKIERIEDDGDRVRFELRRFATLPKTTTAQNH